MSGASFPLSGRAYAQATRGVGAVHLRTVDMGGAGFNWSCCALRAPSDTWGLRGIMYVFCVELIWAWVAFVACLAPWVSRLYTMSFRMVSVATE